MDAQAQGAGEWFQIKRANGPESRGVRTQLLHRLVPFADHMGQPMQGRYDPPSHSTYHPMERCWGMVEGHGHGTKLVEVETRLEGAKSMPWKRIHPVGALSRKVYQKGRARSKKARRAVASRLERHPDLPTWDIRIRPVAALSAGKFFLRNRLRG